MQRNLNNEFERFLKENADQYRMYPSKKVWNGIYSSLHSRRKWFGLGTALLLITGSLVTLLITNSSKAPVITINGPIESKKPALISNSHDISTHKPVKSDKSKNRPSNLLFLNATPALQNPSYTIAQNNLGLGVDVFNNYSNNIEGQPFNHNIPNEYNITSEVTDQDLTGTLKTPGVTQLPNSKTIASRPFDWTIESVVNSFLLTPRQKRFSLQFNFTPTISYRKLSANKGFLRSAALRSNQASSIAALYDVNSVVTHKPDMGLEFGFTEKYAVATNFRVKAGLQFNINRYDIKAFNYPFEVAKIALRSGENGVDSLYTISSHRNYGGYKADWLQNFYFEISAPVGVEVDLVGDDKVQFGVAGTIQPTYVLGDRAYLLSTDYKNYALVPWLIRRWNVNTAFETFVSYSTGKMRWQVGPQIRYQLLSSFVDQYPVKENLFDFGLKVGISVNK
jgi:hypothetical protein